VREVRSRNEDVLWSRGGELKSEVHARVMEGLWRGEHERDGMERSFVIHESQRFSWWLLAVAAIHTETTRL
jgi:hypothetical protein